MVVVIASVTVFAAGRAAAAGEAQDPPEFAAGHAPPRFETTPVRDRPVEFAEAPAKKAPARKAPAKKAPAATRKKAPPPAKAEPERKIRQMIVPPASRVEETADTLFGTVVPDPYRWLEDDESPEVEAWTRAQNGYTQAMLSGFAGRDTIRTRLGELLRIGVIGAPTVRGERHFFIRRTGDQNQPVLYVRDGLSGKPRVLIDPNTLSADSTTALDWWFPSPDGSLVAYGTSDSGSEWSTLRVRDTATGKDHTDAIPNTRAASVAWQPDGKGFYYTRYPAKGSVPAGEENYNRAVYHHILGNDPAVDPFIFGEGRQPDDWPNVDLSKDGRWLIVTVFVGFSRSDVYLKDLSDPAAPWTTIAEGKNALHSVEVAGDALYILTNDGAPRFRLLKAEAAAPDSANRREIIPQGTGVLQNAAFIGGKVFGLFLEKASSRLRVYGPDGDAGKDISLPALGTVAELKGEQDGAEAFLSFSSYYIPPTVYRYDIAAARLDVHARVDADVDTTGYVLKQVSYPSKDGTKITMFIAHRKGLKLNAANPTILYGYGGFGVSQTPAFSRGMFLWLERGGVFAVANLRGGGEYGEDWHQAGMLDRKQNVFDDFLAGARYLIRNKYTSSNKLCIQGGSNGGLLVGAALVQAPELFRAVVCQVPLLDMVRYHKFLIARLWMPEYGSPEDPEQFKALFRYSPYHRVKDGTAYPAVLLDTAASDSRVAPLHARKMAARLQAASTSGQPVLLRLESKAGHGQGKPVTKLIDAYTDIWTFVFMQLGIKA